MRFLSVKEIYDHILEKKGPEYDFTTQDLEHIIGLNLSRDYVLSEIEDVINSHIKEGNDRAQDLDLVNSYRKNLLKEAYLYCAPNAEGKSIKPVSNLKEHLDTLYSFKTRPSVKEAALFIAGIVLEFALECEDFSLQQKEALLKQIEEISEPLTKLLPQDLSKIYTANNMSTMHIDTMNNIAAYNAEKKKDEPETKAALDEIQKIKEKIEGLQPELKGEVVSKEVQQYKLPNGDKNIEISQ